MKKKLALAVVLLFMVGFLKVELMEQGQPLHFCFNSEGQFYISMKLDGREVSIYPWYDDTKKLYYFFLPACSPKEVCFDNAGSQRTPLKYIGEVKGILHWDPDQIYEVRARDVDCSVVFMKSENLPAVFIETESGTMDAINADKEHEEKGELTIFSPEGHVQYDGRLRKISGRGESTWNYVFKKPYEFSLLKKSPLCGLSENNRWNLLALYYEHDKIHSKIIYDLARSIGYSEVPECTWVDLYCEGDYQGLYLLTENVIDQYEDKEGLLLEREVPFRLKDSDLFFQTDIGEYVFKIREPDDATEEDKNKAYQYIQSIEDLIVEKNITYQEYLDIPSIARQYLLDKIAMEFDGMRTSAFYYWNWADNKLYSEPMWDYDLSFGTVLTEYEMSMEGDPNYMWIWYNVLYQDEVFEDQLRMTYKALLPYFKKALNEDIDRSAEFIKSAEQMDQIRADYYCKRDHTCSYLKWESYVKYFKYFLAKRLNYLNDLWEIDFDTFIEPESTGEYHQVLYRTEEGELIATQKILDGNEIGTLPFLDPAVYEGWFFDGLQKMYYKVPIYEDTILYAKRVVDGEGI